MEGKRIKHWLRLIAVFTGLWLTVRYLLPIALPFILGSLVALGAEPGVKFLQNHCRLRRGWASFLGITLVFVMLFAMLWVLGATLYRELSLMASQLPGFFRGIGHSTEKIRQWAMGLAARAPDGLSGALKQWVTNLFTGGTVLLERAASGVLAMAGNVMGELPGGAMLIGTAVISSFMISGQLPTLRSRIGGILGRQQLQKWQQALQKMKEAVGGWIKAQLKLSGVSFCIVGLGFLLLRISNPLFWAVIVALVDAVPLLGTGTILVPWALLALFRGDSIRALGLAGLYVTAMLVRSALEPKLVGRQLGINPLITLVALYAGYCLWGVGGMILAPILTVTAKQLAELRE